MPAISRVSATARCLASESRARSADRGSAVRLPRADLSAILCDRVGGLEHDPATGHPDLATAPLACRSSGHQLTICVVQRGDVALQRRGDRPPSPPRTTDATLQASSVWLTRLPRARDLRTMEKLVEGGRRLRRRLWGYARGTLHQTGPRGPPSRVASYNPTTPDVTAPLPLLRAYAHTSPTREAVLSPGQPSQSVC
jgi:hypothetical protein